MVDGSPDIRRVKVKGKGFTGDGSTVFAIILTVNWSHRKVGR